MIRLAEFLSPRPEEPLWTLIRQAGVTDVVAILRGAEQEQRMFAAVGEGHRGASSGDSAPWSEASIAADQRTFADAGFSVVAIEDTVPMDRIRMGLPGRDDDIAAVIRQVEAMGNLGIRVLCYNWMAVATWSRTSTETATRGGALVTSFRLADAPPADETPEDEHEQMWDALAYFLDAVVPVAERAGVRLGMHPDDPPLPRLRGVPRVMGTPDAYRRLLSLNDSAANGVTFCQGNFALMEGADDVPALIREFGGRVAFSHFRNVRGTAADFTETFHDDGILDMAECMRALADIGFDGPLRPDHVPTMAGEPNARPGYETLGRLFAIGYIRGLAEAVHPVR